MNKKISILSIIAVVLGFTVSLFIKNDTFLNITNYLGNMYITILKFFIVPVVFFSIFSSCVEKGKSKLIGKTVISFIIMFVLCFIFSYLIIKLIDPGKQTTIEEIAYSGTYSNVSFASYFMNLLPNNLYKFLQGSNLLFVIICAYLAGLLIKYAKLTNIKKTLLFTKDLVNKALVYFMYVTPIAVFALMYSSSIKLGNAFLSLGLVYILCAYLTGILCLVFIMLIPICLKEKLSIIEVIKRLLRLWMMTISTCSSNACISTTLQTVKENFDRDENDLNIIVPLGSTIHMCGGAVSFALLSIFCANLYNVNLDFNTFISMLFFATILNMAAPGIPSGGVALGATYLSLLGIPVSFIGFYSGIYKILDMLYTTLNVQGDVTLAIMLAKKKGL